MVHLGIRLHFEQHGPGSSDEYRRIATIQLFEVQPYAEMDPRHFALPTDFPRDEKEKRVDDLSLRYLRRLGLSEKLNGKSAK